MKVIVTETFDYPMPNGMIMQCIAQDEPYTIKREAGDYGVKKGFATEVDENGKPIAVQKKSGNKKADGQASDMGSDSNVVGGDGGSDRGGGVLEVGDSQASE